MKAVFEKVVEWSDFSPNSPSVNGSLPSAVRLPRGTVVAISLDDILERAAEYANRHPNSRAKYVPMVQDSTVRCCLFEWGDRGDRPYGRSGAKLNVIAPAGSCFLFAQVCPWCGSTNGLVEGGPEDSWCHDCAAEKRRQDDMVADQMAYIEKEAEKARAYWDEVYRQAANS